MTAPASAGRQRQPARNSFYAHGALGLVAAILADGADLRGAACAGRSALFDTDRSAASVGYRTEAARWRAVKSVCRGCPVRGRCWDLATSTPYNRRPRGPMADSVANPFPMAAAQQRRRRPAPSVDGHGPDPATGPDGRPAADSPPAGESGGGRGSESPGPGPVPDPPVASDEKNSGPRPNRQPSVDPLPAS